jgi:glutaredoxin
MCGAVGCKLAGELLEVKSIYLNYFGMVGAFLLTLFGYLSIKDERYEPIFYTLIFGALAFESTIIGYQFFANPLLCIFCLGVFGTLFLIALLSFPKRAVIFLTIVGAVMAALSILSITKTQSFISGDGKYLIASPTCPHCKKVKKYLKEHDIDYITLPIKEASSRSYLRYMGISSIPVWIERKGHETKVVVGDENIISLLEGDENRADVEKNSDTHSQNEPTSATNPQDIFSLGDSDGCSASVIQEVECEDEEKK